MKIATFLVVLYATYCLVCDVSSNELVAVTIEDDEKPDITTSHLSKEGRKAYKVFQPTSEWQTIPEGMAIPEGAHVRMNFETGKNEVKLMDKTQSGSGSDKSPHIAILSDGEKDAIINSRHKLFSQEELADALEGIKPEEIVTDEDRERVAKTYRSMEELKQDFEKISASFKTDYQILSGLVNELKNVSDALDTGKLLAILEDVEYLSHQIDNGVELAKMGAIPLIIRYANGTEAAVAEAALLCLGSTMQNNRFVQDTALHSGILSVVYHILSLPATESNSRAHSRALFALSTLLRNFPPAQDMFLKTDGISFVKRLFSNSVTQAPFNERFAVKLVGLVGDLVTENDEALGLVASTVQAESARYQEYAHLNLRQSVVDADWCSAASGLLSSAQHDTREKALRLMILLASDCHSTFNVPTMRHALQSLLTEYNQLLAIEMEAAAKQKELAEKEANGEEIHSSLVDAGEDDYFRRMVEIVSKLIDAINQPLSEPHKHSEL